MIKMQKKLAKEGYKFNVYLINKSVLQIQHFYLKSKMSKSQTQTDSNTKQDENIKVEKSFSYLEIDSMPARTLSEVNDEPTM